jgi:ankyrin repeat protein
MNLRCLVFFSALLAAAPAPLAALAADPPPSPPSLVPRPSAPELKPFTLEDRYLDAARRGDVPTMLRCLEKGVAATVKDATGRSALHFAVRDARSLDAAKVLLAKGLAADEGDGMGRTPLMEAAGNGDVAIVSWLLEQKASVTARDAQGQTPLYKAVLGGHLAAARRLLEAGAAIDARDLYEDTPLMGACAKGNDEMARLLVEKGADPALRDQEGRAARERAPETANYCRSLGDRPESATPPPVPAIPH